MCLKPSFFAGVSLIVSLRSAAQLSYKNVQNVINGLPLGDAPVHPDHDAAAIEHDIKLLQVRSIRYIYSKAHGSVLEYLKAPAGTEI